MSFYIDVSEFLLNPITTGIQRIAGEVCKYLPANAAIPIRVRSGRYVPLPRALIQAIGRYFRDASESGVAEIRRLGAMESGSPALISEGDIVLIPEAFDNLERLAIFREMPEQEMQRYRFIVFDLLPMTHPEYFIAEAIPPSYGYYQLIRRATHCGFISEYTRDTYYGRLKRTDGRGGVVLPLGSDGLGPKGERPTFNRPLTFSVLGTIEPRKNHKLILEAFEPLLRQIEGLTLSFIGRMGWIDADFARKIQSLAAERNSGFRFHSAPADDAIRGYIEQSRATIYVSAAEGYGLPPVESLWVGTPVIASTTIPSLESIGSRGVHYVNPLNAANLRRAVLAFLDDTYANQKVDEAANLNLPTWHSFTEEVLGWCAPEG